MTIKDGASFFFQKQSFREKVFSISWPLILLIILTASAGFLALYSAANGSLHPWALKQMIRFGAGCILMLIIALVDIKFWLKVAYLPYALSIALLIYVAFFGEVGMGARRWVDLKVLQLQPSEVTKIALVLAMARYFHLLDFENVKKIRYLIVPVLMILLPVGLVMMQPDLGTGLMLLMVGAGLLFLAGVRLWTFVVAGLLAIGGTLVIGFKFLHAYQKKRIFTFLNPETDPLGSGYHIIQSKIALGSGGLTGKGFLQGTQSHLNFLPEKQTDFIFTLWVEETGLIGGLLLLSLYTAILIYGFVIGLKSRNHFGRLLSLGLTLNLFLYIFINIAMVMGLMPVVGVPLPLVSYAGTAMLTILIGFGLILNVQVHKNRLLQKYTDF